MILTIQGDKRKDIVVGDFIDLDSSYVNPDPLWGYSFEVSSLDGAAQGYIWVKMLIQGTMVYEDTAVSLGLILDNWKQAPDIAE
jgi:hypothetical protein